MRWVRTIPAQPDDPPETIGGKAHGPVVLVRPETSPGDMRGLAAAGGVVTVLGGPACHAAVVARALGKPAVVGAADLTIDAAAGTVTAGNRIVGDGTMITIDGTIGEIVLGRPRTVTADVDQHQERFLRWADNVSGDHSERSGPQRLRDVLDAPPVRRLGLNCGTPL